MSDNIQFRHFFIGDALQLINKTRLKIFLNSLDVNQDFSLSNQIISAQSSAHNRTNSSMSKSQQKNSLYKSPPQNSSLNVMSCEIQTDTVYQRCLLTQDQLIWPCCLLMWKRKMLILLFKKKISFLVNQFPFKVEHLDHYNKQKKCSWHLVNYRKMLPQLQR